MLRAVSDLDAWNLQQRPITRFVLHRVLSLYGHYAGYPQNVAAFRTESPGP